MHDDITVSGTNITLNGVDSTGLDAWVSDGWITPAYYLTDSDELPLMRTFLHRTLAEATAQQAVADASRLKVEFDDWNGAPHLPTMDANDQFRLWYVDDTIQPQMSSNSVFRTVELNYDQRYVIKTLKDYQPIPYAATTTINRTIAASSIDSIVGTLWTFTGSHNLSTGNFFYGDDNGGALPAEFPDGTNPAQYGLYFKNLSPTTGQWHLTDADATSGADPVSFTDSGSGAWTINRLRPHLYLSIDGQDQTIIEQADANWGSPTATIGTGFPFIMGAAEEPHTPGAWDWKAQVLTAGTDLSAMHILLDTVVNLFMAAEGYGGEYLLLESGSDQFLLEDSTGTLKLE